MGKCRDGDVLRDVGEASSVCFQERLMGAFETNPQEHTRRPLQNSFYFERSIYLVGKQSVSHGVTFSQSGDSIFPGNIEPRLPFNECFNRINQMATFSSRQFLISLLVDFMEMPIAFLLQ